MDRVIAGQIADLLNNNNNLTTRYTASKILSTTANYYPLQLEGLVFGSVAVQRVNFLLSEIKHLVVHPSFRGIGLGKSLVFQAMLAVTTPVAFATVREDNHASRNLFLKSGFRAITRCRVDNHNIVMFLRNKHV